MKTFDDHRPLTEQCDELLGFIDMVLAGEDIEPPWLDVRRDSVFVLDSETGD